MVGGVVLPARKTSTGKGSRVDAEHPPKRRKGKQPDSAAADIDVAMEVSVDPPSASASVPAPAAASVPEIGPTDPDEVLASMIFAYSSDSVPDSDPDAQLSRDDRTWSSMAPWEEEYYLPRRQARTSLRDLFESTSSSISDIRADLAVIQKDMDAAWASHAKKTGVSGPPTIDLSNPDPSDIDPRRDPLNPAFDPSTWPRPDPKLIPPRNAQNQRKIRECLLRIRDTLKPLVKSWAPVDPRLETYAMFTWEDGIPERQEEDRMEGYVPKAELVFLPPYTLKPEFADVMMSAKDPLYRDMYRQQSGGAQKTFTLQRSVPPSSKPKKVAASRSRKSNEPAKDKDIADATDDGGTAPFVATVGDIKVTSLHTFVHPANRPAPATPLHLQPYTKDNTPTLPFLATLLYTFFETHVFSRLDKNPFLFGSIKETAAQQPLSFSLLDREAYLESGLEHSDTLVIDQMLSMIDEALQMYLYAIQDRDMADALEIRRARRAARMGKKRDARGGEKKGTDEELKGLEALLTPFDVPRASEARKDAFAQAFLDTFRDEMETIRSTELEKLRTGGEGKKKDEAERKQRAAQARMSHLAKAIRGLGFRDDMDRLIEAEVEAGKRLI